jgi:hypothetical protein
MKNVKYKLPSREKNLRKEIEINNKHNNNISNYKNIKAILTTNIINKKAANYKTINKDNDRNKTKTNKNQNRKQKQPQKI